MNEQSINKEVDKYDYYKSTDTETKQSTGNGKEKLQDRIKKQNDINYGRSKELYNEKLLKKQLRQHFITIPHTEQDRRS